MASKTRQSLAAPDIQFDDPKLNRLVQLVRAIVVELQKVQQMTAGGTADQILTKTGPGDYQGAWGDNSAVATITGLENVGDGEPLYAGMDHTVAKIRTLVPGSNITLVLSTDAITIASTGGGEGAGTVTSVAINSVDLTVEGSPITESGSIELEIAANAVTYHKMQQTSQDAIVLGRRVGESAGDLEELTAADLALMGIGGGGGYPPQLAYAGIT